MDGNEYAWSVLQRNGLRLESLLDCANRQETAWLEFKADPFCHVDKGNELHGDIVWHTLKEVVAMVNTRGGCIVFGVSDGALEYSPLKYKDGSEATDLDKFHRQIESGFLEKDHFDMKFAEWSGRRVVGRVEHRSLSESVLKYCTLRSGVTYRGRPVSVLLVSPSRSKEFVYVSSSFELIPDGVDASPEKMDRHLLVVRRPGDLGKIESLPVDESDRDVQWVRPHQDFDDWLLDKAFNNMLSPVDGFVGRESLLFRMEQLLNTFGRWRIPLLYGVPGIGKSQLAFRYAQKNNASYDSLVYVDASGCGTFVDVLASLARNSDFRRKFLPGTDKAEQSLQTQETLFMGARMAIAEKRLGRVLLVVDDVRHPNVVRPALLKRYLGEKYDLDNLHVIFTSRCRRLHFEPDGIVEPILVPPLSDADGLRLLRGKALPNGQDELNAAKGVVRYLGGNPWALDLVGEYLCQKTCSEDGEYQRCIDQLRQEMHSAFPPHDGRSERLGNATGVIGLRELIEPTLSELFPEELDICRLLTAAGEDTAIAGPLRAAYDYMIGGEVDEREWNWLCESLKAKMILRQSEDDKGDCVLSCCDPLLAKGFAELDSPPAVADAYMEYLRHCCRRADVCTNSKVSSRWRFIRRSGVDRARAVSVLFDEERIGWPLGLLGIDTVARVRWAKTGFSWNDVMSICQLAEGASRCAADVFEIRALGDVGERDGERHRECVYHALSMRREIYANEPRMLGRSYLHAAQQLVGGTLPFEELDSLLKSALDHLPADDDTCLKYRLESLDMLAYCASLNVANCDGSDESMREKVRSCLMEIVDIAPDYFQSQNNNSDDIDQCIAEGSYPRG